MIRLFIPLTALAAALAIAAAETKKKTPVAEPKTFAEKEKIAVEMKKISKQLDVKCEYCHTDAERGLKEGDFTLLTKEGEYAHDEMFPISEKFKVECSHCHLGGSDMTKAGDRAHKDMKFMSRYRKQHKKNLTCTTCHIPGEKGQEFTRLTAEAKKLQP
ncbi:MAG: hypothetical protein J0L53_09695 [Spirochaetes bacterium]|nr:hypothetical protein [Spirochaetota bacterium]MBX3721424.1 hypothetical protein [Turneriella sp.]